MANSKVLQTHKFDRVRALEDSEIRESVQRITRDPEAIYGLGKYWLGRSINFWPVRWLLSAWLRFLARNIHSISSLHAALAPPIQGLVRRHLDSLHIEGMDALLADDSGPWLFISNHRDIALDPLLLNLKLWELGQPVPRVAIGDNLLQLPDWGSRIMRAVGCFMVDRTSRSRREQYQSHQELSGYIRYLLTEAGLSVWLAQRSGRSLDGRDSTDPTVLKMLHLCDRKTPFGKHMAGVNLVPVTLSYEYIPCDRVKAERLATLQRGQEWQSNYAQEAQDGLISDKGRVWLQIGEPLRGGDWQNAEQMAADLDARILSGYKLWPSAFAAAQQLRLDAGKGLDNHFGAVVCPWPDQELGAARQVLCDRAEGLDNKTRQLFLEYYANPLFGRMEQLRT